MNLLITWWSSLLLVLFLLCFILFYFHRGLCFARFQSQLFPFCCIINLVMTCQFFFPSCAIANWAFYIPLNMKLFKFFQLVSTIFNWILNWIFIRAVFLARPGLCFGFHRSRSSIVRQFLGAYCFLLFMRFDFFSFCFFFRSQIIFTCWHGCSIKCITIIARTKGCTK